MDKKKLKTIKLNKNQKLSDHSASDKLLNVRSDFTYIIKKSTGIGGTTLFLREMSERINFIITPTRGVILDKQEQYIQNKNGFYDGIKIYFVCTDSLHTLSNVIYAYAHGEQFNVMLTVDQMDILLKNDEFYALSRLRPIIMFIDEIHLINKQSIYRTELNEMFINIIQTPFPKIVSTATPLMIEDIIIDDMINTYEYYEVEQYDIKPIELLYKQFRDKKAYKRYLVDYVRKLSDKKVLISSNSKDIHLHIHKHFSDKKVIHLVGDTLKKNLAVKMDNNLINHKHDDADIIVISSSYHEGFDIIGDTHIILTSSPKITAYTLSPTDIRQIIGRVRSNILSSTFLIDYATSVGEKDKIRENKLYNNNINLETDFRELIYKDGVNLSELYHDYVYILYRSLKHRMKTALKYYNINFSPLINEEQIEDIFEQKKGNKEGDIVSGIEYLCEHYTTNKLKGIIAIIKTNMTNEFKFNEYDQLQTIGSYSVKLVFTYYMAYLVSRYTNIPKLQTISSRNKAMIDKMYKLILDEKQPFTDKERDDFILLHEAHNAMKYMKMENKTDTRKIKYLYSTLPNREVTEEVLNTIGYNEAEIILANYDYLSKRVEDYKIDYPYSIYDENIFDVEISKFKKKVRELKNKKDDNIYQNEKSILRLYRRTLLYFFTEGKGTYYYKEKEGQNRYYTPLTSLPRSMRMDIPIQLVEFDIQSANPTFIDLICNTNMKDQVYDNISKNMSISREDAKTQYNRYLNSHKYIEDKYKRIFFNKICNYDEFTTKYIIDNSKFKDSMFKLMTAKEKYIVDHFTNHLVISSDNLDLFAPRLHDAVFVKYNDIKEHYNYITTELIHKFNNQFKVQFGHKKIN